jgi:hypothetical protein
MDATYVRLCENILAKMDSFDNAVVLALQDDSHTVQHPGSQMENAADAVVQANGSIAYYTQTD